MKPLILSAIAATAATLVSCSKESPSAINDNGGEIILEVTRSDARMKVHTRTSALNSMPQTLYWEGTSGEWKNETPRWDTAQASVMSGSIQTGRYQTAVPSSYNYYVSSNPITFGPDGSTIVADNSSDTIAGCTQGATTTTAPTIILEHIFARTGTLGCTPEQGYEASGISWKIESTPGGRGGKAGTYNIATKEWSSITSLDRQDLSSISDLYCIPGEYSVTVSYTLSKGDYSETNTISGNVTLVPGKVNHITCTLPVRQGGAHEINIGVSLAEWENNPLTLIL